MLGHHKAIAINEGSPYGEELRKHEAHYTKWGPPLRPYPFKPGEAGYEFPKMLYRAVRATDETGKSRGISYEGFVVNNDTELTNMCSRGYSLSQSLALEALEREQLEHGTLAAERNYEIKHSRISEKAASEVRAAEAEHGARHLPMVPETPIKRRGRPRKVSVPAIE